MYSYMIDGSEFVLLLDGKEVKRFGLLGILMSVDSVILKHGPYREVDDYWFVFRASSRSLETKRICDQYSGLPSDLGVVPPGESLSSLVSGVMSDLRLLRLSTSDVSEDDLNKCLTHTGYAGILFKDVLAVKQQ